MAKQVTIPEPTTTHIAQPSAYSTKDPFDVRPQPSLEEIQETLDAIQSSLEAQDEKLEAIQDAQEELAQQIEEFAYATNRFPPADPELDS